MDWGSMGPGEEWVNSATLKGEQGKTQLSQIEKIKIKRKSTLNRRVEKAAAHKIASQEVTSKHVRFARDIRLLDAKLLK